MLVATMSEDESRLLTVAEVADQLRVGPPTVLRWIREGKLVAVRLGGPRTGYRITLTDLNAFIHGAREVHE